MDDKNKTLMIHLNIIFQPKSKSPILDIKFITHIRLTDSRKIGWIRLIRMGKQIIGRLY